MHWISDANEFWLYQSFGQNKASQCDLPVRPLKDDSIMYVHIFYTNVWYLIKYNWDKMQRILELI